MHHQQVGSRISLAAMLLLTASLTACPSRAAEPESPKIKELLQQKLTILKELAAQTAESFRNGVGSLGSVQKANRAVLNAELDLCETKQQRVQVLEKMVAVCKDMEKAAAEQRKSGVGPATAVLEARVHVLEAEIALERGKGR